MPHHASVQIVPNSVCADSYSLLPYEYSYENFTVADSLICAAAEGKDACQVVLNTPHMK
ncbi:hypothetical protein DPMN_125981 [Dreissena polymorpha]|uniref:Uncharacterized protein n=1 Tax=Dreissena polymorpha TaxID=45954 RepID=A0A9D4JXJ1_DREPO|nr:hypothetical protein DPMN_125981 [Dreissena polymorpha]